MMLRRRVLDAFDDSLPGRVGRPGDPSYEEARRVWNGMVDRHPGLVVRCQDVEDVVCAVRLSREHRLAVTVKAGGHSVAGASVCDGGVVLDMTAMRAVDVDERARTVVVGPGARWRDVDAATQAHGLATTGGIDSRTGAVGLTLGGGLGYLARRCGLAADNLLAADVVVAGGEVVRASESEDPDLLWGLRGGGGGLGVVTRLELRLHPLGSEVPTVQSFHTMDHAAQALRFYRELMADGPDELTCYALLVRLPPDEAFPRGLHGVPALVLSACWTGQGPDQGGALTSVAKAGDPFAVVAQPVPYLALQSASDAATPDGRRYYWKSHYLHELSDAVIATLVRYGRSLPGAHSAIGLEPLGGAVGRVPASATAFPHREAGFGLGIWSGWSAPAEDERIIAETRALHAAIRPHATGGMYANYLDRDDLDRPEAAYGRNWERLQELRGRYGI